MMVSAPDILAARILIVDDQESNVSLIEQLLSEAGYTCVASTVNARDVCALHQPSMSPDGFNRFAGAKRPKNINIPFEQIAAEADAQARYLGQRFWCWAECWIT